MSNEALFVKALLFGCFNFESAVMQCDLLKDYFQITIITTEKETNLKRRTDDWHVCNFTTLPKSGKLNLEFNSLNFLGKWEWYCGFRQKICINWEKDKKTILILVENTCLSIFILEAVCNPSHCHKSFVFVVCDSKGQRTTKESFQMEYDLSFIM